MATLAGSVAAEPIDDADASHGRAGYSATGHLPRLHQDAGQGSPLAQYVLGALYQLGKAVPQDHREAVKWFSRAADQGLTVAQFALGGMYAFGHGVPEDIVRAHMWLDLSAIRAAQIEGGQKLARDAQQMRDTLERKMTPAQIAEAQHLAREWRPKHER